MTGDRWTVGLRNGPLTVWKIPILIALCLLSQLLFLAFISPLLRRYESSKLTAHDCVHSVSTPVYSIDFIIYILLPA